MYHSEKDAVGFFLCPIHTCVFPTSRTYALFSSTYYASLSQHGTTSILSFPNRANVRKTLANKVCFNSDVRHVLLYHFHGKKRRRFFPARFHRPMARPTPVLLLLHSPPRSLMRSSSSPRMLLLLFCKSESSSIIVRILYEYGCLGSYFPVSHLPTTYFD